MRRRLLALVPVGLIAVAFVAMLAGTDSAGGNVPSPRHDAEVYEDIVDPAYAGDGCTWLRTEQVDTQIRDCGDKWQSERTVYSRGKKTIYRTSVGPPLTVVKTRPVPTPTWSYRSTGP